MGGETPTGLVYKRTSSNGFKGHREVAELNLMVCSTQQEANCYLEQQRKVFNKMHHARHVSLEIQFDAGQTGQTPSPLKPHNCIRAHRWESLDEKDGLVLWSEWPSYQMSLWWIIFFQSLIKV